MVWLYDIYLDGKLIGDQGDMEFETSLSAKEDARAFIKELSEEYDRDMSEFELDCYPTV